MVSAATALSVGTGAVVQKRPTRKWNAAPKGKKVAVLKTKINAKPAKDHNKEVLKETPIEPPSRDASNSSGRHPKDVLHRREQIELTSKDAKIKDDKHEPDHSDAKHRVVGLLKPIEIQRIESSFAKRD